MAAPPLHQLLLPVVIEHVLEAVKALTPLPHMLDDRQLQANGSWLCDSVNVPFLHAAVVFSDLDLGNLLPLAMEGLRQLLADGLIESAVPLGSILLAIGVGEFPGCRNLLYQPLPQGICILGSLGTDSYMIVK